MEEQKERIERKVGKTKVKTYIHNFIAYKELLKELVQRDIRIKYRRSFLGMLWSVLNPLGMMIIMTLVFSHVFRAGIDNFPVYLMCGQVIFNFFNEATTMAMQSILGNAPLIRKVYLPKYLFPMSKVCSCFVNLLTSCIALALVVVVTRTPLTWKLVLFVFPILYVFLFSLGIGILLSAVVVTFRDLQHLYGVIITGLTYLTPIFYPIEILPGWVKTLVEMNPLTSFVEMFRDAVLYGVVPGMELHIRCTAACVVALVLGIWSFIKQQDTFILKV